MGIPAPYIPARGLPVSMRPTRRMVVGIITPHDLVRGSPVGTKFDSGDIRGHFRAHLPVARVNCRYETNLKDIRRLRDILLPGASLRGPLFCTKLAETIFVGSSLPRNPVRMLSVGITVPHYPAQGFLMGVKPIRMIFVSIGVPPRPVRRSPISMRPTRRMPLDICVPYHRARGYRIGTIPTRTVSVGFVVPHNLLRW
jgi:hypothetical protein